MKKLISFFLRRVPRSTLQRISRPVLHLIGLFYRGNNVTCPIINVSYRKFLPYGRINPRPNALCPDSLSLERHRLLWLYLHRKTDFFDRKYKFLHVAPEVCFISAFKKQHGDGYITGDIESPLADVKMDILNTPFPDNTFDAVMCNHVMEHVSDDVQAMREIYRVLKPGGWAVMQVPFYEPVAEKTFEDPTITDASEREKVYGQDDHVRLYGKDYPDRIRRAGFNVLEDDFVKTLSPEEVNRYALPKDEIIFFSKKPE